MVVLSGLVFFRPLYVGIFGLVLIFGHNAFDQIHASSLHGFQLGWMILHEQNFYQITPYESIFVLYPLVPWIGVMAAGYAFGTLFRLEPEVRKALFIKIGLSCLLLFVVLRYFSIYGDPHPWEHQTIWWKNILAFIKVHKYPPSLQYLLVTLGVSITALGLLEKVSNKVTDVFLVFGRVPMFYYIPHIYIIHISQVIIALNTGGTVQQLKSGSWSGYSLPVVYLIWFTVVFILYFPCRWFMKIKQRRKDWWLSYL